MFATRTAITMTIKHVWWIIIVLIYRFDAIISDDDCAQEAGCICDVNLDGDKEIICPVNRSSGFKYIWQPNEFVQLRCNNMKNLDNQNLKKVESKARIEVKTLKISGCEFGDSTNWRDVADILKIHVRESLRIEFSYNNPHLTKYNVQGLSNIKHLTLTNNDITDLSSDFLSELPELVTLNLRQNRVHLPVGLFKNATNLRSLELSNNHIESLDSNTFHGLENLKLLNLWNNRLMEIKDGTFDELISLESLDLHLNLLSSLSNNTFKNLKSLKSLNLSGNNFTSLPEGLLNGMDSLKNFSLSESKQRRLATLPKGFFKNLKNLEIIKLMRNGLTEVPIDMLLGAENVREIYLNENTITTLSLGLFHGLSKLKILYLKNNQIQEIDEGVFSELNELTILNLSRNRITSIPKNLFIGLNSLRELYMNGNGLKNIHPECFGFGKNVKILNLDSNELTLEEKGSAKSPFHLMSSLETLILSKNRIRRIFADWNMSITNLKKLDLSYNNVSLLHYLDLRFVSYEIEVDLTHNNISQIILDEIDNPMMLDLTSSNVKVKIDENPINCGCNIYNLLRYIEGRMDPNVEKNLKIEFKNLNCQTPLTMRGKSVRDLDSKTLRCMINNASTTEPCERWMRPEDRTYIYDCSYRNLTSTPNDIELIGVEEKNVDQIELNFNNNMLTEFPDINAMNKKQYFILHLAHNQISRVPPNALPSTLKVLELHNNNIRRLNHTVVECLKNSTSLENLTLHNNPWECDCDSKDLLNFIQTNLAKIPSLLLITCKDSKTPMTDMTVNDFCPVKIGLIVTICLAIAFFSLLIGSVSALYYKYQREIKVWLYAHQWCLWFVTENELDKDKIYDAFISFSHKDHDFVVKELVSKLENGPKPFKLCLHYRNWLAGEWIPTQIARSVEESRRTIVVLSPNFLESVWGRMEFRAAHSQALSEGRARVIVILYGEIGCTDNLDPELKAYLNMNTYVKWGDPWFWDKLLYALPHSPKRKRNMMRNNILQLSPSLKNDKDQQLFRSPDESPPLTSTPPADSLQSFICDEDIIKIKDIIV